MEVFLFISWCLTFCALPVAVVVGATMSSIVATGFLFVGVSIVLGAIGIMNNLGKK